MTLPDPALHEALAARADTLQSWDEERGEATAVIAPEALVETCAWLMEQGFVRLSDITAIDTLTYPVAMPGQIARGTPRFGVVFHLAVRPPGATRLRLRVFVPENDAVVPSVVPIWPGANFFEREVYDLMGITFAGHPDLRRIMLAEEWVGHPLRKDLSVGGEPVEFSHTVEEITRNRRKADA
jgi:NADH-quinone oxidoreductase subunit C